MLKMSDFSVELPPAAARLAALLDRLADEDLTLADSGTLCEQIRGLVDGRRDDRELGIGRPQRSPRPMAAAPIWSR